MGTLLAVTRVLSCIQPTGDVHLGSYLGALRQWVQRQHEHDAFHGIVDLHALTVTEEPGVIGQRTVELAAMLFAVGLDPDVATVFVQSHVAEHSQLAWVMECTVSYGELSRMTQFKDKSAKREATSCPPGCSPTRRCRPPTSCCTTPTTCRSATTSASTSRSPATSPSASTTASARRSSSRRPSPRRSAPA